MKHSRVGLYL